MGGNSQTIGRFLVACMTVGFAALVAAGFAAAWVAQRNQAHSEWVSHTYQVEVALAQAGTALEGSETARRGYLLTGRPEYLSFYHRIAAMAPPAIDRIGRMTADNPRQQANTARLRTLLGAMVREREHSIALSARGRRNEAVAAFADENDARAMQAIRDQLARMHAEEARLLTGEPDPARAADALLAAGAQTVVITLGADGALLRGPGMRRTVPGRSARPLNATGAGDTFAGTLVARMAAAGWYPPAIAAALDEAITAAAQATERWGAVA